MRGVPNDIAMLQIPLFPELICYVCGKGVRKNDSISIGGGLKRHIKCKPGSRRWQKQQQRFLKRPDEVRIEEG
jgi:hypothetical protein